ncbi:hypothetical protein T492DRAFT_320096 [Pavlovales sp. CCMP2436]|nr:hypothetical protein T492DRAFT_320096 [Pavlovales sp. CCMP2436]
MCTYCASQNVRAVHSAVDCPRRVRDGAAQYTDEAMVGARRALKTRGRELSRDIAASELRVEQNALASTLLSEITAVLGLIKNLAQHAPTNLNTLGSRRGTGDKSRTARVLSPVQLAEALAAPLRARRLARLPPPPLHLAPRFPVARLWGEWLRGDMAMLANVLGKQADSEGGGEGGTSNHNSTLLDCNNTFCRTARAGGFFLFQLLSNHELYCSEVTILQHPHQSLNLLLHLFLFRLFRVL